MILTNMDNNYVLIVAFVNILKLKKDKLFKLLLEINMIALNITLIRIIIKMQIIYQEHICVLLKNVKYNELKMC